MSKLPSIYKEEIKVKSNNKKYCYVTEKEDIESIIKDLLKNPRKVLIKTTEKDITTYIYDYKDNYINTIQNEKISLDDIISIKRIS